MPRMWFLGFVLSVSLAATENATAQSRSRSRTTRPVPNSTGLSAEWLGQTREDRVSPSVNVGPDGLADAKIVLKGLLKDVEVAGVVVKGPAGLQWHSGVNPNAFMSAELIRRGDDPTIGDLFLAAERDLKGQTLSISVHYKNDQVAATRLVAGKYDPKLASPKIKLADFPVLDLKAQWLGQDGNNKVGPGDVHVVVSGLPRIPIAAACLSNASKWVWSVRLSDKLPFDAGPDVTPMALIRGDDPTRADLHFPPFRDETGTKMTLRLLFEDGRTAIARFPGGKCDAGLRSPDFPAKTSTNAKPGDDLHALVNQFGTIHLAQGVYRLNKPLILSKPIVIQADPGATLEFSQDASSAPWAAAIKVHVGHSVLEGFAVRFATPIRWVPGVDGGPAVIGATDNTDPGPGDIKGDLTFRNLDLEGPPTSAKWEETPRLLRMNYSLCGVIEGNTLKGGSIEVIGGPWRIVRNRHVGTPLNTFTFAVISGHRTHDLVVQDNQIHPESGPTTKTWRFLVLTQSGVDDLVSGNTVENVGPRNDDKIPGDNAPEIILTESYSLHFEGKPSAVSASGRILALPQIQGEPLHPGDAVAILTGPSAGEWRRIDQVLGSSSILLDPPMPKGSADCVISIATGFVRETFRKNTIDCRGSGGAGGLVLVGNHFGLKVLDNHLSGGLGGYKIAASPTEKPVHWGWSHGPLMGAVIEGNILEDCIRGGIVCVEHSQHIKSNKGRVYASVRLKNNTAKWSPEFAASAKTPGREKPVGLTLGDPGSHDPGELVITEEGNHSGSSHSIEMKVMAAKVNGVVVKDRSMPLPAARSASR